jgi:hypothetical protein
MSANNGWKNLNVLISKKEYKQLVELKGEMSWRELLQQVIQASNEVPV